MTRRPSLSDRLLVCSLAAATAAVATFAAPLSAAEPVRVHALVGATVIVGPGETIPKATLIIRDGRIEAVGASVSPPADARIWDLSGKTLAPAFVEVYAPRSPADGKPGAGAHENSLVRPDRRMADEPWDAAWAKKFREAGFSTAVIVPSSGLFRGQAALVSLGDGDSRRNLIDPAVAQVIRIAPRDGQGREYPNSMMGAIALFRQVFLDAGWTGRVLTRSTSSPDLERPTVTRALESLAPALAGKQPMIFETDSPLEALRAIGLAKEFGLRGFLVGSGKEYQRAGELARTGWPVAIPLAFPKDPKFAADSKPGPIAVADEAGLELQELRHWDRAPGNAARLSEGGVRFAFTSYRLDSPKDVLANARKAIAAGLPADRALAALTTEPATLLGVERSHGTLAAGKAANILVASGDLFAEKTKLSEIWIDGERHALGLPEPKPAGSGNARSQDEEEHP